jgi:hypothetical protein
MQYGNGGSSRWRRRLLSSGLSVVCLAGGLLNTSSGQGVGGDRTPDYAKDTQSYQVPFAGKVDFKHLTSMHLKASFNGGPPVSMLVDTGSTGIVVSADEVPNIDPKAPPGVIRYSSSGLEFDGVWTTVTLTFPDAKDANGHVVTAIVPVLAVKERKVISVGVNGKGKTGEMNPRVHMFGVGFGRGAEGHPEKNPFLNLTEMQAGTMRRGYTITRTGFTLGLTAAKVGPGYLYEKLTERPVSAETTATRPGLKDWQTPTGSLTVDTLHAPMGTVLIDTGLTNMMIAAPNSADAGDVASGTPMTIDLLGGKLHYSFKVGDTADPLTPRRVTWIKPTHGAFVNTGLRALAAFDYLYDADGGYVGLRPVADRP